MTQTHTALSAGTSTAFPNSVKNGFEYAGVASGDFKYGSSFPNGASDFRPWTFVGTSGIAANGCLLMTPQVAPELTHVAFLEASGSASLPYVFQPGNWRLRFKAAQRQNIVGSEQVVSVTVGGVEVFEAEILDTTFRAYTTRTFHVATAGSITVVFAGTKAGSHMAFLDLAELEPIRDWNEASTWSVAGGGSSVPDDDDDVVIPHDVEVAIRGDAVAGTVTVRGDLVTCFENASLSARWVKVERDGEADGAHFEVGQEGTPFEQLFTLTLRYTQPNENEMNAGTAFLMAMDSGTIDMHGKSKTSWTKLTSLDWSPSQPIGGPSVMEMTVDDHTGWDVGDEVVIAYTGHVSHTAGMPCSPAPYTEPRSERRTITAINPTTGVIKFNGVVTFADHGTWSAIPYANGQNSWILDQRAEVGNLTRNIRIQGDQYAATTKLGGHVMIMDCCTEMLPGLGHFANVELANMGQSKKLGRYPMHWHMALDLQPGQYLRNSSIHDSSNRAVTVHGTHDVVVERNVCCDIMGHAMFLEDGGEHGNMFLNNLVLAVRKPASCEQMLPHDNSFDQPQNRSPAAFWISNPANHYVGNVAADSLGVGYWFALHSKVTGKSSELPWQPLLEVDATKASLGSFTDNVAHSLKMGIDVHDSVRDAVGAKELSYPCPVGVPPCAPCGPIDNPPFCSGSAPTGPTLADPLDDDIETNKQWRPTTTSLLQRFTAYGCTTGLYSGGGIEYVDKIVVDDSVLADNGVHVHFASADTVSNSVLVHDTGHGIFPIGATYLHAFESGNAYVVYDGPGQLVDCHMVGYAGAGQGNLVFHEFGAARRHTGHRFEGLTFAEVGNPRVQFSDYTNTATQFQGFSQVWGIVVRDVDGCLTGGTIPSGAPSWSLITNHEMLHLGSTPPNTPDLPYVSTSTYAWLSPFPWAHLQVRYYASEGSVNGNGLYPSYAMHKLQDLPYATFSRRTYQGWPGALFDSQLQVSSEMRQVPVIVRPTPTDPECVYDLQLKSESANGTTVSKRVDISVDDSATGQMVHLYITNRSVAGWTPTLRVNDVPQFLQGAGENPISLPSGALLSPSAPSDTTTTYQMTTVNGVVAIDLRMVNPPPSTGFTGRTHRITITWP